MDHINNVVLIVLLILGLIVQKGIEGAGWDYHGSRGPDYWAQDYPKCAKVAQSPVDIDTSKLYYKSDLANIVFTGYDSDKLGLSLTNNGHAAQVNVVNGSASISGGSFKGESYKLAQFHFHWGGKEGQGSEHTVNGHAYDAELHFVHHDAVHGDLGTAAGVEPDGLAVLGVFLKVGQYDHPEYKHITDELSKITYKGASTTITSFSLKSLLPDDTLSFLRYQGSLTTPPCHESVTWTVFDKPVTISKVQMDAFRSLVTSAAGGANEKMVDNFRPVQPLGGRPVYSSQKDVHTSGSTYIQAPVCVILFSTLFVLAMILFQ